MRQKVYNLLTLMAFICLLQQASYAQNQNGAGQSDSTKTPRKITISVKDLSTSQWLDSVRITLGRETKFTTKGVVIFENTNDSVAILSKPGYYRLIKKVKAGQVVINMHHSGEVSDFISNAGLLKKDDGFSGSAVTVNGTDLRKVNSLNFFDALKYYVPSVTVTRSNLTGNDANALPSVTLRGSNNLPFSTITPANNGGVQNSPSSGDYIAANVASGAPVILLDGIQVSLQTAFDIDINRIQRVTVLKDATATASYGMRGANGLIVIETVKPKDGLVISFTEQVQLVTPDISSYQSLSGKEKIDLENNAGLYAGSDASPIFNKRYNQAYNEGVNTDWLALPLQNGVGTKHTLALSSTTDDVAYGLTASYNDVQGSMKGSYRKNLDLGAHFGGHFGSFSFSNQFNYLGSNSSNSTYGSLSNFVQMNPYWNPYDKFTGKFQKFVEIDTVNNDGVDRYINYANPAYNATLSTTDAAKYVRYSNTLNLNWVLGSGFQLNGIAAISKQSDELNYFLPPNHTIFSNVTPDNLLSRGYYKYTSNSFMDVQGGVRLQYERKFGKHELFTNVGQNVIQNSSESETIAVSGFAVDRLADISFGSAYATKKPASNKITTRYASTFANLVYSYDNRYQVDFSGALDYYSGINNPEKFGALGLSWNLHNEKFLQNAAWVNSLKLKGSIGVAGNQYFLSYLNKTGYNYFTDQQYIQAGSGAGTVGKGLGGYLTSYGNNNLQSPQTFKQNIGFEGTFFNNRLNLSFEAFKQVTSKLILPETASASSGFQNYFYYQNIGEIENGGFEFTVAATLYRSAKNNLNWNVMLNAFHATDKINTIAPYLENVNVGSNVDFTQTHPQSQYVVGKSVYSIWAVPSLGIDPQTGNEIFLKKDGATTTTWDANDKVYAGSLTPSWTGSFGTDLTFRQFSAGVYFNYQYGAKVYNQTMADIENANIDFNVDARALVNRWSQGQSTAYKALSPNGLMYAPTYATTRLIEDDNKIQCSSVMLGYRLPRTVAEKIRAKNLALKVNMNNAFEIGGADIQRGIYYPFQRNYTFTLNANF